MKLLSVVLFFLLLSACSGDDSESVDVAIGKAVFEANCAVCHGKKAGGLVSNWQEKGADGKYPAPPLDGTAHTWHHSPLQLLKTINEGGYQIGGQMPAFEKILTSDERQAALDYVFSLWPSEIKTKYDKRFN